MTTITGTASTGSGTNWVNPTYAAGADDSTYTTWTSSTANDTATLTTSGWDFSALPDAATIDTITCRVKGYVSNATRLPTWTCSPKYNGTLRGSQQTFTTTTGSSNVYPTWTITATVAELKSGNFTMENTLTRYNGTSSSIGRIDSTEIIVDYHVDWTQAPADDTGSTDVDGITTSKFTAFFETPADDSGLTDTGAKYNYFGLQNDSFGITDDVTSELSNGPLTRTFADDAGLADSISFVFSKSEDAGLVDYVAKAMEWHVADDTGLTDVRIHELLRADDAGLTDTPAKAIEWHVADDTGNTDSRAQELPRSDDTGLVDSLAFAVSQTFADDAGLTDARTHELPRSDSAGLADSLAEATEFNRAPADDAVLTDARVIELIRSDDAGLVDTCITALTITQTAVDAADLTDAVAFEYIRTIADDEALTDEFSEVGTYSRTVEDDAGLSDTPTPQLTGAGAQDYTETPTEQFGITDSQFHFIIEETGDDPLGITDSVTVFTEVEAGDHYQETPADDAGLVDVAIRQTDRPADAETISLDSFVTFEYTHNQAEDTGLTDSAVPELVRSDSTGLVDSAQVTEASARVSTEDTGLIDTIILEVPIAEAIGMDDPIDHVITFERTVADDTGLVDSLTHERACADDAGLVDEVSRAVANYRACTEDAALTDAISLEIIPADDISLYSSASTQVDYVRTFTEELSLTDVVTTLLSKPVDDDAGLVDTATASLSIIWSVEDALDLADEANAVADFALNVNDDISLIDATDVPIPVSDDIGLTDDVSVELTGIALSQTVNDDIGLTDEAFSGSISDDAGLTDEPITAAVYDRYAPSDEYTWLTDEVTVTWDYGLDIADDAGLVDETSLEYPVHYEVAVDDLVDETDGLTLELLVADAFDATDEATTVSTIEEFADDVAELTDALVLDVSLTTDDDSGLNDEVLFTVSAVYVDDDAGLTDELHIRVWEPIYDMGEEVEVSITDEVFVDHTISRTYDETVFTEDTLDLDTTARPAVHLFRYTGKLSEGTWSCEFVTGWECRLAFKERVWTGECGTEWTGKMCEDSWTGDLEEPILG